VVGLTLGAAKTRVRKAHCLVGKITRKASSARKKNHVLAQRPRPGRKLADGGRVRLAVGRGPR
jgi:beta-lactam-binding protein with PASTA domain